jgi:hypothetical protein
VSKPLGPRPTTEADRARAVQHASDVLDRLDGRRAQCEAHPGGHASRSGVPVTGIPTSMTSTDADDSMAAVVAIDSADDSEVRRLAHGAIVGRAAQGGWDRKVR